MKNLISSEDVKSVAISLGKNLTIEEIDYVLENYREETTDNWSVIVEDLIYQLPRKLEWYIENKQLVDAVIGQITEDLDDDCRLTLIELLKFVPKNNLIDFLAEYKRDDFKSE